VFSTAEFKVGLLAAVTATLVGVMSFTVSDNPTFFGRGASAYALLPNAAGLNKRGVVHMAGINIGVIKDIKLENEKARVELTLDPDMKLRKSARLELVANGILGDKSVEIYPGDPNDPPLEPGGQIMTVIDRGSFEAVINKVAKIADDVNTITDTLKKATTGDGDESSPLGRIILNIEDTTADLRDITESRKDKIEGIIDNMHEITSNVNDFIGDEGPEGFKSGWKKMSASLHRVDNVMRNVEEITDKINSGRGTIGKLVNDETTVEELNTAIASVNKMLDTANKIQTSFDYHYEYLSQGLGKNYLSVTIQPGLDRYYLLGIVDDPKGVIERTDTTTIVDPATSGTTVHETKQYHSKLKFNAQFAKNFHDFTIRAGLVESTGGVGFDYAFLRRSLRVSTEFFDLTRSNDNLDMRAYVRYRFLNFFYVTAGGDDVLSTRGNASAFGGAGIDVNNDDLKLFFSKVAF